MDNIQYQEESPISSTPLHQRSLPYRIVAATGLATTEKQVNNILLGIAVLFFALAIGILFFANGAPAGPSVPPSLAPQR